MNKEPFKLPPIEIAKSALEACINLSSKQKLMQNTERSEVPVLTNEEKLAAIDRSIESCFEILKQELDKKIKAFWMCSNDVPIYLKKTKTDIIYAQEWFNFTKGKKPC